MKHRKTREFSSLKKLSTAVAATVLLTAGTLAAGKQDIDPKGASGTHGAESKNVENSSYYNTHIQEVNAVRSGIINNGDLKTKSKYNITPTKLSM